MIQYDPVTKAFSSELPFHTAFTLDVPAPADTNGVLVSFWEAKNATSCDKNEKQKQQFNVPDKHAVQLAGKRISSGGSGDPSAHYQVSIPALHAGETYCMEIEVSEPWTTASTASVVAVVVAAVTSANPAVKQADLATAIAAALGPLNTRTVNDSPKTVADAIAKSLWEPAEDSSLKKLFDAATSYAEGWKNLVDYHDSLVAIASQAKAGGATLSDAQSAAIAAVVSALEKSGITTGAAVPNPPTAVADVSSVVAALNKMAAPACGTCTPLKHLFARSDISSLVSDLDTQVTAFTTATQALTSKITAAIPSIETKTNPTSSEISPTYVQEASFYISGDIGFMIPFFVNGSHSYGADSSVYVAASFSFVAIDKDVSLKQSGGFWRRFSVLAGFTLDTIKNNDGSITGAMSGKGIIGGVGYRVTDYLRIGGGMTFVRQNDTDRLLSDTHLAVVPYLSLSIDSDVVGVVSGIFKSGTGLGL